MVIARLSIHAAKVLLKSSKVRKLIAATVLFKYLSNLVGEDSAWKLVEIGVQDTPIGTRRSVSKLLTNLVPESSYRRWHQIFETIELGIKTTLSPKRPKRDEIELQLKEIWE
jgi:hypothetical protein